MTNPISDARPDLLERLRRFDTCTLSNAIERLNLRPRTTGHVTGAAGCLFRQLPPVIGYAVTAKMRSSMPPVHGRVYYEHTDFWKYVADGPRPKILVIQDADPEPRSGALIGEAYARISRALGCVAGVTDGVVRDVPGIEKLGYQVFAGGIAVSHAYAHVVEYGDTVEIGGLRVAPGDLLHGDLHGVHSIPLGALDRLEGLAEEVLREDRDLFSLTERRDFTVDLLVTQLGRSAEGEGKVRT
jgi:regulator of RNase E activity RraA